MLVAVGPQQVPGSFQEGPDQQEAKLQVTVQLWVAVMGTPMALQVLYILRIPYKLLIFTCQTC